MSDTPAVRVAHETTDYLGDWSRTTRTEIEMPHTGLTDTADWSELCIWLRRLHAGDEPEAER